ncbi:MAG: D-glycero-beta-D-manno-heptose 1-phosphate adenylyltransferase [Flavobacteriales bacterium]|nr:D-glycero-beta-D-manno-heptose 1-phosphate adenylyltransferase [Flavobacteriales bacterium]MBT4478190.1 D-glycero-beta-D-manno-heptose 1-phosphate adenylyltransferase [Flavobacteriales bacterium]MBT5354946.1 D-glycero-beta-D-manno-heptose 1-phosphate adenylyltransferase [Flavobacteriales bacterium]MBT6698784.1 D-glycero-beta-D-manno-heptose 1-phosphate adenylyltransferase [Flavobacteriales bacterium]MBT6814820.1 D-glycero-beta-D-manno-heptose 1-phosphate adenylyltransferase [Flavobacteriales
MSNFKNIKSKIYSLSDLKIQSDKWKENGEKIVFTNGCFDLVHRGHIEVLANTADLGDKLIIGLNSDSSIKELKGENRPIMDEISRAILLASLQFVDAIVFFSEETPYKLIETLIPDVLAKGGDYKVTEIAGNGVVLENGGEVILFPFIDGVSSTKIVEKIKQS